MLLEGACGTTLLEVTHCLVQNHPPAGNVHCVRAILLPNTSGYCYDVQVLLVSIKTGVVSSEQDFIELCNSLLRLKGFVFCPGIGYRNYNDNYYSVIRFHKKQANLVESPFQRVEAIDCFRWYKLPKNATLQEQASNEVLCSACKQLLRQLEQQKKQSALVSPNRRVKCQAANSNYPTKYLSPVSTVKRKKNAQTERAKAKVLLAKYSKHDVTLDDSQHEEMCNLVSEIEEKHSDELEEVYKEASGFAVSDSIREVWTMDKQRHQFYSDQAKNSK